MHKLKKAASILLFLPMLLLSCGKSPIDARKELAQIDIPFEKETCEESVLNEDQIATDLFLASDIAPGCLILGAMKLEPANLGLVKKALNKNVNPEEKYIQEAFRYAISNDQDDIAKLLINKGVKDDTVLNLTIEKNKLDIAKGLLKNGANPDATHVMYEAGTKNNLEAVKLLVKYKANPNPALLSASHQNHIDLVKYLLSVKADPNYDGQANQNSIALGYASHQGHKEIVKLLLEKGANPNSQISDPDSSGWGFGTDKSSCLSWAVQKGHLEVADLLRKSGATDDNVQEF